MLFGPSNPAFDGREQELALAGDRACDLWGGRPSEGSHVTAARKNHRHRR